MKYLNFFKLTAFLAITFLAILSCARDQEESTPSDPFIGNWKLKAVSANGQTQDVSNAACWKDSKLNVSQSIAEFILSVPNANTGSCQSSQDSYQWSNNNGTYYYTENGQQQTLPIQFFDNNATLQLNLDVNGTVVSFSFTK